MRLEPTHPLVGFLIVSAIAVVLLATPPPAVAAAGDLVGDIPVHGAGLVVWGGGTTSDLSHAAEGRGCHADILWITDSGRLAVYVYGAPDVVNAAFAELFPGGMIASSTALVLMCSPPVASAPASDSPAQPSSFDEQFAAVVFEGVNQARATDGHSVLNLDTRLRSAAESYARLLLDRGELSHSLDGQPWERAQRVGYPSQYVGEVLVSRSTSLELSIGSDGPELVTAWMESPPHRAIILGRDYAFTGLGVGCATGVDPSGLNAVVCVALLGAP
ncbi:MAG: CAP domain-containing protein [Dehalococcoidia bacterium]